MPGNEGCLVGQQECLGPCARGSPDDQPAAHSCRLNLFKEGTTMEALILVIDMGFMLYLCWRIFRGRDNRDIDLGVLDYDKSDARH